MGIPHFKAALIGVAFLLCAAGCASPDAFGGSRERAIAWAQDQGFQAEDQVAGGFRLLALVRPTPQSEVLTAYIEGDGAPWVSPWHPPRDPTPLKPVALAMAASDRTGKVVYLGRPCQYQTSDALAACNPEWWMQQRFAAAVVEAYDEVLSRLKITMGVQRLRLVGYSGGGVIAALLAARRPDVDRLITVAAPLALNDWAQWHELTPFAHASDPLSTLSRLSPGVHWVGRDDPVVPPWVVERFTRQRGDQMVIMPGYDHVCCWTRDWGRLIYWGSVN